MEIAAKQRDIIAKRWFCDFNVRGESDILLFMRDLR